MDLSIVIALFNEEESIVELFQWIRKVLLDQRISYEVLFIDDGSSDNSWSLIQKMGEEHKEVKGIQFRRNYGKSAALNEGFAATQGDVVITMDADLQDNPNEIPELYAMIKSGKYDLVSGWKKKRHDPLSKTIPTKLFNAVNRRMSGIQLHDFNCGLKAYRSELVKSIEVYGDMHRYIPVLAKSAGFGRIGEKVVQHQARKYGTTKFGGIDRFINGFLDLLTLNFIGKYGKRPMHFFGLWGVLFFLLGFFILLYLSVVKIIYDTGGIAERPLFYFGILTLIIGTQLFVTGFLAELVSRNANGRNNYLISERLGFEEIS